MTSIGNMKIDNLHHNTEISATEFKKHFLSLVDEVRNQHASFVITKRKLPVAKITPLDIAPHQSRRSYFGFMKGVMKINGDIVNYSSESDWEANNV